MSLRGEKGRMPGVISSVISRYLEITSCHSIPVIRRAQYSGAACVPQDTREVANVPGDRTPRCWPSTRRTSTPTLPQLVDMPLDQVTLRDVLRFARGMARTLSCQAASDREISSLCLRKGLLCGVWGPSTLYCPSRYDWQHENGLSGLGCGGDLK